MEPTKAWDWTKNESDKWLVPCVGSAYLSERWASLGYSRLLDLGCGLGRHSVYLAKKGFSVTAADLSEYGVNHTREWAEREGLSLETVLCNMLELPFADRTFDGVLSYNVIYHTDTQGFLRTLSELWRVLRPGGELYITLISKNTWGYVNAPEGRFLDENTILRDEHDTERDVPHFYAGIDDIRRFFSEWEFPLPPVEMSEYSVENPAYCSRHWNLLLRKPRTV